MHSRIILVQYLNRVICYYFIDQKNIFEKMPSSPRVTVSLDIFDDKVISEMSKYRDTSKSEIIRNIIHQWIEENPDTLRTNYGINFRDINKEIIIESKGITIQGLIEKLPSLFKTIESIALEELADFLEVDQKTIKNLIFEHSADLQEKGIKLKYVEGVIKRI